MQEPFLLHEPFLGISVPCYFYLASNTHFLQTIFNIVFLRLPARSKLSTFHVPTTMSLFILPLQVRSRRSALFTFPSVS